MFEVEQLSVAGLVLFCVVSTSTPGPNNIMLLSSSVNYGPLRTIPHSLGIIIGFPLMVLAVGMGLGQFFQYFPMMHAIIKCLGVAYLVYLAWRIATADSVKNSTGRSRPLYFQEAALFQWLNPKAWTMATTSIAAFTPLNTTALESIYLIVLAFLFASVLSSILWVFGGAVLTRLLNLPARKRIFNRVMGILLLLSIVPMIATTI